MKKTILIIADILLFIAVSIASTLSAAKVDAGSIIYSNPWDDGGHVMSMKEAVIYNVPLGMFSGIVAAFLLLFFAYLGMKIYEMVQKIRNQS